MITPGILIVLIIYGAILLGLGIWGLLASKDDMAGYYVADKQLPSWVIAFSSNATGESAWLLLGLTGMGYVVGLHALWVVVGEVLGVALAWTFVARPFKAWTDRYDSITVPDYLEDRFRDRKHVFRVMGAVIVLTMVGAYTAAQLTATGKAFDSFLGTGYREGVFIGLVVILFYTVIGGFKAVAYSDFVQGLLMFLCLLILPFITIGAIGGWGAFVDGVRAIDPALLTPGGEFGWSAMGIASAVGFVGVGLAFLGAPQLLTRFMAARDQRQLIDGGLMAVICMIVFDTGAVFAGLAGRVLFPGLADSETILPVVTTALLPDIFIGIVLVIVLAAIMSTVDSVLILASSSVVRDVVQKVIRPNWSERRLSALGRLTTIVLGVVGLVLALGEVRVIFWFVLFAWSGLACAFAPVVLLSLFWKRTTRAGAIAGMAGGFLVTVAWVVWFKPGFYDLYEMIPGFLAGTLITIVVSLSTEPPEGAAEEMASIREQIGQPLRRRA